MRRGSRSSRGFTLLELMLTILIGSILMALAVPAYRTMTVGSRLTTQANDLVSAINLARSEAIKRNSTLTFCRTAAATSTACVTATGTWANWMVMTSGGTVLRRGTFDSYGNTIAVKSGLTLDTIALSSDGMVRTGSALVTNQTITVCTLKVTKNNLKTITLGRGSRISLSTSNSTTCP